MVQTFEQAACFISSRLLQMSELAERAQAGIYSNSQRQVMQEQFENVAEEINYIANNTSYNGNILSGTSGESVIISLGDGWFTTIDAKDLTIDVEDVDLTTDEGAASAEVLVGQAASETTDYIAYLAGRTKVLESASELIAYNLNNALSVESISDADLAREVTLFAAKQVLESMGAIYRLQMNIVPELVLSLLGADD